MNKLLRADFARLFRSKCFWISAILCVIYPVFICVTNYIDASRYDYICCLEDSAWSIEAFLSIAVAVLIPVFIGTEYSDKTIRNKIVIGHGKSKIFVSNIIVCVVASAILLTIHNIVLFPLGLILFTVGSSVKYIVMITLEGYAATILLSVIMVILSMFISRKTAASITCIMITLGLLLAGVYVKSALREPEFIQIYDVEITDAEMDLVNFEGKMVPNSNYIREGIKRDIYEYVKNMTVGAQIVDVSDDHEIDWRWFAFFDSAAVIVFTIGGALLFKKKEIN